MNHEQADSGIPDDSFRWETAHARTPYFRKGDKIALTGTLGQELEGALEPAATEHCLTGVVKNGGQDTRADVKPAAQEDLKQLVKHTLRFSFQ